MRKYVLALNSGSSSLKFNLFLITPGNRLEPEVQGIVEEIGSSSGSNLKYSYQGKGTSEGRNVPTHKDALTVIFELFGKMGINSADICSVGHRVVHGGDRYSQSVLVDEDVLKKIRELIPIAPLHNPPNLMGIEEAVKLMPEVPQVVVFDTAFHATIPEYSYRYAIPGEWYSDYGVRKYGFHGTSHLYVSRRAAKFLGIPYKNFNCITVHLGNGCSVTKVEGGRSRDTSLGFTPLEGLIMGTRSGDIDPALIPYVAVRLMKEKGLGEAEAFRKVFHALNRESGLKALAGTNMMQEIRKKALDGDTEAENVISIYAYRVARYIGSYWATMPSADAIVFTAGLGENEGYVRKKVLEYLKNLKIEINEEANKIRKSEVVIGESRINPDKPLLVMVVPTNEEIVIGYDALYLGYMKQNLPEVYPFEMD